MDSSELLPPSESLKSSGLHFPDHGEKPWKVQMERAERAESPRERTRQGHRAAASSILQLGAVEAGWSLPPLQIGAPRQAEAYGPKT